MSEAAQLAFPMPVAGLTPVTLHRANALLAGWGHYLGPVNRPYGAQSWALDVAGEPVSVAVSASIVSAHVICPHTLPLACAMHPGRQLGEMTWRERLPRNQVVELARLCSAPGARWATRPMLRLWREIAGPLWPYWQVTAAVAYSQNARHGGTIYRFDGWQKASDDGGSSGGGTWSRKRHATEAVHGRKSLWLWRYPVRGAESPQTAPGHAGIPPGGAGAVSGDRGAAGMALRGGLPSAAGAAEGVR